MKKLLFFATLAVFAIGAGVHINMAHAQTTTASDSQTLTPAQAAALEQQLDVAKAQLANLQMEAGQVPSGDSGSAATTAPATTVTPSAASGLSESQITALKSTLGTLATMLTQLNASIAADASLTASQQTAIASTLSSMNNVLVAMVDTVQSGSMTGAMSTGNGATAPAIAQSNGGTGSAAASGNGSMTGVSAGVANSGANSAAAGSSNNGGSVAANTTPSTQASNPAPAQTAQASGIWSFTKAHWPTIVIVLLVLAILAILFWPEKQTTTVKTVNQNAGKPKVAPSSVPTTVNVSQTNAPTPMANAAGATHK